MKKVIILIVSLVLILTIVSGCTSQNNSAIEEKQIIYKGVVTNVARSMFHNTMILTFGNGDKVTIPDEYSFYEGFYYEVTMIEITYEDGTSMKFLDDIDYLPQ